MTRERTADLTGGHSGGTDGTGMGEGRCSPAGVVDECGDKFHVEGTVEVALSAGLVEPFGEGVRLSEAGAAFLRRHLARQDAFRAQHQIRRDVAMPGEGGSSEKGSGGSGGAPHGRRATINELESPLGWLRRRKDARTGQPMITVHEFEAGERLRADFYFAQLTPRVTSNWSDPSGGRGGRRRSAASSADMRDHVIAAKRRFYRALDEVGEDLSEVLVWVCCDGRGLSDVERQAGWPRRAGKVVLVTALRALGRHYGLLPSRRFATGTSGQGRNGAREDGHGGRSGGITHWGAEGYRPDLARWED